MTICEESDSKCGVKRQVSAITLGGFRRVMKASLHSSHVIKFEGLNRRKRFDAGLRSDSRFCGATRSSDFSPVRNVKDLEPRTGTSEIRSVESQAEEAEAMTAIGAQPNQSLEPTTLLVMPRACARVTPSKVVAHL